MSGAPVHLGGILNKYGPCKSKTVVKRAFFSAELTGLNWSYDVTDPSEDQLREIIDWAPEKLVDCYLNAYVDLWEHNTVTPGRRIALAYPKPPCRQTAAPAKRCEHPLRV